VKSKEKITLCIFLLLVDKGKIIFFIKLFFCFFRDYAAEAVQFFVKKLEKFGPELQIKSLLG